MFLILDGHDSAIYLFVRVCFCFVLMFVIKSIYFLTGCSSPLGLATGEVLDWQISASSWYPGSWDPGCHMKYARLHQPNGRAWCAGQRHPGEWLLVDLGVPAKVIIYILIISQVNFWIIVFYAEVLQ